MSGSIEARLARIEKAVESVAEYQQELVILLGGRLERSTAETDARFSSREYAHTGFEGITSRIEGLAAYPVANRLA